MRRVGEWATVVSGKLMDLPHRSEAVGDNGSLIFMASECVMQI